jgi:hypothetical protein
MAEENRRAIVSDALRPVMEEGEEYRVYCHEGEVFVEEAQTSICSVLHPRLYGRLLSLNTQLDEAGAGMARLPMLVTLAFCVALHLHLLDDWLGVRLADQLNNWWFFLLVLFAVFQLLEAIRGRLRYAVYQRHREELHALILREELDPDTLLAQIEGDPSVATVGHQLKLDNNRGRPAGMLPGDDLRPNG